MALEDTTLQDQLAQAPPQAPTAADAEANKAAADSAAAQSLANAASNRVGTNLAVSPKAHPYGIVPNEEDVTASDIGQKASPVAPYNPSAPAPGSLGYHLMKAFSTPAAKEPGGGVKALFSGVTDALLGKPLNEPWKAATTDDTTKPTAAPITAPRRAIGAPILDQLGDAAAAAGPGGLAGGFARAAAAGGQRSREEMNDRRLMATANAQMLHEQALVHKMGEDEINSSIATSTKQMENLTTPVPDAPTDAAGKTIATDKTSDELNQMIKSGELNPTEETVFATGRVSTGKDTNGVPQFRTTYTVVKPAKEVELSPENAKYLNENLGLTGTEAYSTDPEKPQRLPGVQVNQLFQQANNARVTKRAFEVKEAQEDETIRKAQTSKDAETIFKNPVVMNAINGHMSSPDDPFAVVKAYDAIMNNPKLRDDPSMPRNFSEAYIQAAGGTAVWDKKVEEYSKAQAKNQDTVDAMLDKASSDPKEIEGHTPAFTAAMKSIIADPDASPEKKKKAASVLSVVKDVQQGEIDLEKAKAAGKTEAATGYQGDPNATTPEMFLSSLKPDEQSLVNLIHSGRAPLIRLEYLAARKPEVLAAVERAYPGQFDASKVKSYMDTYKDFTSGKTSTQLNSGGTALLHLKELEGLNTVASHIPGTPAWNAYENKVDTLSTELAKFYGDATVPAIAAIKKTLMANLPGGREAAIHTQAKSMGDKMDSFETTWTNAAPSKAYQAPMPHISTAAKQARAVLDPDYAKAHPEFTSNPQNQSTPSTGPTGGTHPMVSQDGKTNIWLLNNQWVTADGKPYRP